MSFHVSLQLLFKSLVCLLSLVLVKIQPSLANPGLSCDLQFLCGTFTAGYPFWGRDRPDSCGHPSFLLNCEKDDTPTMMISNVKYRVLNVNPEEKLLKIASQEYSQGLCPQKNNTIDSSLLDIADGFQTLELIYGCPKFPEKFMTCNMNKDIINYMDGFIQFTGDISLFPDCNTSVLVPVSKSFISAANRKKEDLEDALKSGFEIKWKVLGCDESCISCGYDAVTNKEICYCQDGILGNSSGCSESDPSKGNKKISTVAGIAAGVVGIVGTLAILLLVGLRRHWKMKTENDQIAEEAFIKNYESLAPRRYCYSDVNRMTKSFSYKLGQGGYGDVYKGKLPDGRLVAVKVLKNSKGNGEEFINEVASISRTSHVNIVSFLGFCYEKQKKALIYEFLPNGSLDQFIYDEESSNTNRKLEWRTIYQIAVGIAKGLAYLHRGCSIRIVHFDIKPHNILLDDEFCPKISDFGLAKLSEKKESIISMLDARGTIGYIAPEVFCRTFGGVSHKSDVYSYGMMILEMVVGRKNANANVSRSSEIYFPNAIYKNIEPGNDFQLDGVVTEEEKEMAKLMILVSLWCIQTNPYDRPSMHKVLEMLEGGIDNLQIPPKPSLSSPRRSAKQSSTASLSTELASQESSS